MARTFSPNFVPSATYLWVFITMILYCECLIPFYPRIWNSWTRNGMPLNTRPPTLYVIKVQKQKFSSIFKIVKIKRWHIFTKIIWFHSRRYVFRVGGEAFTGAHYRKTRGPLVVSAKWQPYTQRTRKTAGVWGCCNPQGHNPWFFLKIGPSRLSKIAFLDTLEVHLS